MQLVEAKRKHLGWLKWSESVMASSGNKKKVMGSGESSRDSLATVADKAPITSERNVRSDLLDNNIPKPRL